MEPIDANKLSPAEMKIYWSGQLGILHVVYESVRQLEQRVGCFLQVAETELGKLQEQDKDRAP